MNIEKIKIKDNCYVWVDKDVDIKDDKTLVYSNLSETFASYRKGNRNRYDWCHKIIAASPELELVGIPDYVDYLSDKVAEGIVEPHIWALSKTYFKIGYEKAEQEMFTEEDLKKAIELAIYFERSKNKDDNKFINPSLEQKIIEQIKSE